MLKTIGKINELESETPLVFPLKSSQQDKKNH